MVRHRDQPRGEGIERERRAELGMALGANHRRSVEGAQGLGCRHMAVTGPRHWAIDGRTSATNRQTRRIMANNGTSAEPISQTRARWFPKSLGKEQAL